MVSIWGWWLAGNVDLIAWKSDVNTDDNIFIKRKERNGYNEEEEKWGQGMLRKREWESEEDKKEKKNQNEGKIKK